MKNRELMNSFIFGVSYFYVSALFVAIDVSVLVRTKIQRMKIRFQDTLVVCLDKNEKHTNGQHKRRETNKQPKQEDTQGWLGWLTCGADLRVVEAVPLLVLRVLSDGGVVPRTKAPRVLLQDSSKVPSTV